MPVEGTKTTSPELPSRDRDPLNPAGYLLLQAPHGLAFGVVAPEGTLLHVGADALVAAHALRRPRPKTARHGNRAQFIGHPPVEITLPYIRYAVGQRERAAHKT